MNDRFDEWNEVKKETQQNGSCDFRIKPKEIYWAKIGCNVGDEQYGKGKFFSRPVLNIRQLTRDLFIGVPTTTTQKDDSEYKDNHNKDIKSSCMILQVRTFSKKRLTNKIGKIDKKDFIKIVGKLRDLFPPIR